MSLLNSYLTRQNLFYTLIILLAGTGLYLLTDLFERLDDFLEANMGFFSVMFFFLLKTPAIISQILPAVFLLAIVVQLNILERSRELVALKAGGVSPLVLVRFILIYGVVWALGQFFFSQVVGSYCERSAAAMWQEEVRGNKADNVTVQGLWFTDKDRIIHLDRAWPAQGRGIGLLVYKVNQRENLIEEIIRAKRFTIEDKRWVLHEVIFQTPAAYTNEVLETMVLPIRQDLKAFRLVERSGGKPGLLPFWELGATIKRLQIAGSNVEALRTLWHGKLAYAFSLVVMGLLGLVISQLTPNIYKAVGLCLLLVFLFYALNTLCSSLGEKGMVSPLVGAWFTDALIFLLCIGRLLQPWAQQRLRGKGGHRGPRENLLSHF